MELLLSRLRSLIHGKRPDAPRSGASKKPFPGALPLTALILGAVLLLLILRLFVKAPPGFLLTEDKKFEQFTENIFRNEMSGSTLNLHYTIADPSRRGLPWKCQPCRPAAGDRIDRKLSQYPETV